MVSDWIRDRTQAARDTTGELDRSSRRVEIKEQELSDYEKEEQKLRNLTKEELESLLEGVEVKSKRGDSKGPLLNGYAIDIETLRSLQSKDHLGVKNDLAVDISNSLIDSNPLINIEYSALLKNIIKGFVYLEVPGFKTPIVKLLINFKDDEFVDIKLYSEEDIQKVIEFLKREKKLLPISFDFKAL